MALNVGELYAQIKLDDTQFRSALDNAGRALDGFAASAGSTLSRVGSLLAGAATTGAVALGGAIAGAGYAGLSFNNAMEQASQRINAFTKDAAQTEQILAMIRERAANTPFAFDEMATAAAALIPVANQSGQSLEDVIAMAEILAASNPAQGLEGAAIALREAASGDFVSVIERFNLSRSTINDLKDEGVPALEAVRRAMLELGYDSTLVGNMAETMQGRWGKITDTLQMLAGTATKPVFDRLSAGLGQFGSLLEQYEPQLTAIAEQIGQRLGTAIDTVVANLPALVTLFQQLAGGVQQAIAVIQPFAAQLLAAGQSAFGQFAALVNQHRDTILTVLQTLWSIIVALVQSRIEQLKTIISAVIQIAQRIGSVLAAFGSVLVQFWEENGQQIIATLQDWMQRVQQIFATVVQIILAIVLPALDWLAAFIRDNQDTIVEILSRAWNFISTIVSTALGTVHRILNAVLAALQGDWETAWDEIGSAAETLVNGIVSALQGLFEGFGDWLSDFWNGLVEQAKEIGTNIVNSILESVQNAAGSVQQAVSDLIPDVQLPFSLPNPFANQPAPATQTVNNYNLTAQYLTDPTRQPADDLRLLRLLGGG